MKRFTVRKVKCYSYSRQGWILKDCGFRFVVYDREWRKNIEAKYGQFYQTSREQENTFKNIETFYSHAGAQCCANWFNENKANEYGYAFHVPGFLLEKCIKL